MLNIENKLDDVLKKSNSLPFLFVGSGISRRYLDLPNWGGLLEKFSDNAKYHIGYYNEDYPKVASIIEEEFYKTWWESDLYLQSRKNHNNITKRNQPFKIEIANYFKNIDYDNYNLKDEIEELKKANIDGIITTNYDTFLETIFDDFQVYKGQDDLFFNKTLEVAEIYKIHGCATKFETIVISDNDYARFKEQNIYLTSKLTSLFMEHPIIFLGYSLNDDNIITILKNIASSIGKDKLELLQDRIIFVEYETNKSKQFFDSRVKQIEELIIPITHIKTDDFLSIYKTLSKTKRKIPAKCLRMMENSIYELVKTNDPQGKMAVIDIENIHDYTDIEFYAGVGVVNEMSNKGYNCIESIDLFEDLIFDEDNYKFPENILTKTLPQLFHKSPNLKNIPIFKYLKASAIDENNYIDKNLHKSINDIIELDSTYYKITASYFEDDKVFIEKLFNNLDNHKYKEIDLERFQSFLIINKNCLNDKLNPTAYNYYKRLACLYDRLKYGWFQ